MNDKYYIYSQNEILRNVLTGVLVTVFIVVAAFVFPFLALPLRIFTPMPLLFYRSKLGKQHGRTVFFLSSLIVIVLFRNASILNLVSIVDLMLVGLIIGELFERKLSIELTLFISCTIVLFLTFAYLFYHSVKVQVSILSIITEYINNNINSFLSACKEANISNEITTILQQQREYIVNLAVLIMPSSATIALILITWINTLAAKLLMERTKLSYPNFGYLNRWSAPEKLIWGLISFALLVLIGNETTKIIGINGIIIVAGIYFFQGIAIISFYLVKNKIPMLAKIIIYSIIFINHIFLLAVILTGLFDMWFDFRKIEAKRSDISR